MPEISEGSVACITAAVEIDGCAAQDTVEPCFRNFLVAKLVARFKRFEQALLNCIGGKFRICKTLARKPVNSSTFFSTVSVYPYVYRF